MDRFCVPVREWHGDLTKYIPKNSATWNSFELSIEDLGDGFFDGILALYETYKVGRLDASKFANLDLDYSVPCSRGSYNLIPNGRGIKVTITNAPDYFARVNYEYDRLMQMLPKHGDNPNEIVLDERDLPFLRDFESHTNAARELSLSGQNVGIETLGFCWNLIIPERNCSIPLRPSGGSIPVQSNELGDYFTTMLAMIHEIQKCIKVYKRFPPPPLPPTLQKGEAYFDGNCSTSSTAARLREQREIELSAIMRKNAVPLPLTEKERALFSPTHGTGGLFSPPQHLNM